MIARDGGIGPVKVTLAAAAQATEKWRNRELEI
jgi:hypothetical protein